MLQTRKISFISGIICGLAFAPVYFFPGIFALSILAQQITRANTQKQAAKFGYFFGFGFYLSSLYWIAFGVSVYIEQFWWAIPFALFGVPAFLALFISTQSLLVWQIRESKFFHIIFCLGWLFMEWLLSWVFTGLPWAMIGYAFSISTTLVQSASIFGVWGLSFVGTYIGSIFYNKNQLTNRIITSLIILTAMTVFGYQRLNSNPTILTDVKIRIIQPSIPQTEKWDIEEFWSNLNKHIALSQTAGEPDIIIWSEAALTAPYYYPSIKNALLTSFTKDSQVLIFGGVNDNRKQGDDFELYSSMMALNSNGDLLFDYHKSHLVPFGEYMPFSKYLPLKKLTPGIIDYKAGTRSTRHLSPLNLTIQPMICYESVFADEVKISNQDADLIINITNDAWYGNSSGPYQHFEINRMRSIENGLPMLRAANNGISAIIDPLGRIIQSLELNKIDVIDGYLPQKLPFVTKYSKTGKIAIFIEILYVLILQSVVAYTLKFCCFKKIFLR
jgi:apolipoprotein N-acyltransferase